MLLKLQRYCMEVTYVRSKLMHTADALSLAPIQQDPQHDLNDSEVGMVQSTSELGLEKTLRVLRHSRSRSR